MIPSLNKIVDRVGEAKVRQVSKYAVPLLNHRCLPIRNLRKRTLMI